MRKGLLIHNLKAGSLDVELLPKLVFALGEVVSVDIEQLDEAGDALQYAEASHPCEPDSSGLGETRSSPCLLSHQLPQRRRLPSWNNSRSPLVLGSVSTSSAACCPATPPARCGAQKRNPVTQGRGSGRTPDPPTRDRGNWQRDLSVSYGNAAPSDLSRARTLPSPQSASAGTR